GEPAGGAAGEARHLAAAVEQPLCRVVARDPRDADHQGVPVAAHGHARPFAETSTLIWSPCGSTSVSKPSGTTCSSVVRPVMTRSTGRAPEAICAVIRGKSKTRKHHVPMIDRSCPAQTIGVTGAG